jgi:hypothetical protein
MAVAYCDWIDQVFNQVDQVAYIITAVRAPGKSIAKVGMRVTDTSFPTEYNPSLSRMCYQIKVKK